MMGAAVMSIPKEQRPYKRYGAAIAAWKSRRSELVLSGPAGTGKSRACLEKLHFCADKYAGMRGLIVRKTRTSVTQTAMVTFEQKVLPEGWLGNIIHFRSGEQEYRYPNGSIIAVGGLDKSSKIMSSEWDMVYVQEATELSEEDWEALTTRLRNNVMPYQQLLADCNPGPPTHWLKLRAERGATLMLESRHEDNPAVTPEYLATLDALTGVRYLRLRKGIWAAAEGLVYDEWNPSIHVLSRSQLKDLGIFDSHGMLNRSAVRRVLASVDWGWTNPGVILVWAIDGDGRMYLIHEIYQTQQDINWWIEQGKQLQQQYRIEQWVCDPAEPSYIDQFKKYGLHAHGGVNDIAPGISQVQSRLKLAGDGRPRLFCYEQALRVRDEARVAAYQPFSVQSEILEYVWPKAKDGQPVREVPVKINDHSLDALRYMALFLADPLPSASELKKELDARQAARSTVREKLEQQRHDWYW